jgi:hypothetical protein
MGEVLYFLESFEISAVEQEEAGTMGAAQNNSNIDVTYKQCKVRNSHEPWKKKRFIGTHLPHYKLLCT